MKTTYLILFACMLATNIFGQNQILKEYDFSSNHYTLIGFPKYEYDTPQIGDSIQEFYIKGSKILMEIQKKWTLTESTREHNRTTYVIYLCKEGDVIEALWLDQVYNVIHTKDGDFSFNDTLFTQFIKDFKKPKKIEYKYDSIQNARSELSKIRKDSNLILAGGKWFEFEGEFDIFYPSSDKELSEEEYKSKVESIINDQYKNEPFNVNWLWDEMEMNFQIIEIKCNKSLFDRFELEGIDKGKWKGYDLHLTTWKTE